MTKVTPKMVARFKLPASIQYKNKGGLFKLDILFITADPNKLHNVAAVPGENK